MPTGDVFLVQLKGPKVLGLMNSDRDASPPTREDHRTVTQPLPQ